MEIEAWRAEVGVGFIKRCVFSIILGEITYFNFVMYLFCLVLLRRMCSRARWAPTSPVPHDASTPPRLAL